MKIRMSEERFVSLDEDYIGLCLQCGHEQAECEPDTERDPCEECGLPSVYGAEQLLAMGRIEFVDDDEDFEGEDD